MSNVLIAFERGILARGLFIRCRQPIFCGYSYTIRDQPPHRYQGGMIIHITEDELDTNDPIIGEKLAKIVAKEFART